MFRKCETGKDWRTAGRTRCRSAAARAIPAVAACFTGCFGDLPMVMVEECGVHRTVSPIYGGSDATSYLHLSEQYRRAIVQVGLSLNTFSDNEQCSGVMVSPTWLLTAAHCAHGVAPQSITVRTSEYLAVSKERPSIWVHPTLDLMLVKIAGAESSGASYIRWWDGERGENWRGQLAEIAGYGATQKGTAGTLLFAVEAIVEMTDTEVRVSGNGLSGGCAGDSGGPLLARDRKGEVVVLGVLSRGAASCTGLDAYVRLDTAREWLESVVQRPERLRETCQGAWQACFSDTIVQCAEREVSSESCSPGEICAWSSAQGAYDCLRSQADPCRGLSPAGACDGSVAQRCERGALLQLDCAACEAECVRSPYSGKAGCRRL